MLKAEVFLKDQFSPKQWAVLPTMFRTAYAAAEELIRDNPILQVESARDNRGRIVTWAVDLAIERAIQTGALDCECRWRSFAAPTGRYLELQFSHSRASISQVAVSSVQPRNVVFRENARMNNGQIFLDLPEFNIEEELDGLPHFLIVHGHQTLNFIHLGVPSATSRRSYSYQTPNLMNLPHEVEKDDRPPAENTDYDIEAMNLLKEQIEKWRRENDLE